MQKKFKLVNHRYHSDRIAFDAPKGFKSFGGVKTYDNGVTFFSPGYEFTIHVSYCDEFFKLDDGVENTFIVKRGDYECEAFYLTHRKHKVNTYCERYAFEPDEQGFNCVCVILNVLDESAGSIVKVLKRPEIKAFFDSIEFFY